MGPSLCLWEQKDLCKTTLVLQLLLKFHYSPWRYTRVYVDKGGARGVQAPSPPPLLRFIILLYIVLWEENIQILLIVWERAYLLLNTESNWQFEWKWTSMQDYDLCYLPQRYYRPENASLKLLYICSIAQLHAQTPKTLKPGRVILMTWI